MSTLEVGWPKCCRFCVWLWMYWWLGWGVQQQSFFVPSHLDQRRSCKTQHRQFYTPLQAGGVELGGVCLTQGRYHDNCWWIWTHDLWMSRLLMWYRVPLVDYLPSSKTPPPTCLCITVCRGMCAPSHQQTLLICLSSVCANYHHRPHR